MVLGGVPLFCLARELKLAFTLRGGNFMGGEIKRRNVTKPCCLSLFLHC